ncbi:MAG TPA: BACON domain-containing carbohydrate-binding protein [Vicinamibacterales bacterium]|jgi:hypothetical protein|nr:BACON domain-containing carbohydrate-binding protein [Vicinamibacterales bacterium]
MKIRNTIAALLVATSASSVVAITTGGCGQSSTPTTPTTPSPTPTPTPNPNPNPNPTPNPTCTITLNPTAQSVPLAGGVFFSQVTTSTADCPWTASADSSWIVIASGGSGNTSGPVTYTVAQNNDVTRTGTLIVRGASSSGSVSIAQLGATECVFTLDPSAQSVGASGGAFQFTVTRNTVNGCSWSATTATPWITLTGATSGLSPATIRYSVGANTMGTDRTGAISLAWHGGSAEFVVAQSGH